MGNNKNAEYVFIIDLPIQPVKKLYTYLSETIGLLERKRAFSTGKIHWAMASTLFSDLSQKAGSSIRDLLKNRIITHHDTILPKGFSGSFHSLLLKDELEKEINWGLSNPWSTGIKDLFNFYPDAWIPADFDLLRSPLRFFYDSYPYIWVILPGLSNEKKVQCLYKTDLLEFPSLTVNGRESMLLSKIIRKLCRREHGPVVIRYELQGGESFRFLEGFLESTEKLSDAGWTVTFDCLDTHLLQRQERKAYNNSGNVDKEVQPHTPVHRLERIKGYRNHLSLQESEEDDKVASFLHDFGKSCSLTSPRIPAKSDIPFKPKERSLFANMPGSASIAEQDQAAEFENGRLKSISFLQTPITCGLPVRSYVSTGDETKYFQSATAFTFEDDHTRGLRETLILDSLGKDQSIEKGGSLVIDYFFQEEVRDLVVSVYVHYPEFSGNMNISAFAPLEMPLFFIDRSEHLVLQGWYPDEESYSMQIPGVEAVYEFPGAAFCFSSSRLHLTINFATHPKIPISLLPAKVIKMKKNYLLSINPMGSYRPCNADYISGIGESFTFLVSGKEGEIPLTDVSSAPKKGLFDPPWIRRQESP